MKVKYLLSDDRDILKDVGKISHDFFMSNENNPIVCEVNADPAICDIEELSGKNVAGIFVDYVISEIY